MSARLIGLTQGQRHGRGCLDARQHDALSSECKGHQCLVYVVSMRGCRGKGRKDKQPTLRAAHSFLAKSYAS